jgi:gluconate 2-dehydrogenase gamma chain
MGGQGVERREILRYIGIASVAATFPGFKQWAFACSHERSKTIPSNAVAAYTPLFFNPQQYLLIEHLAEMIIPADNTPGATEAGVAEFIDFMVANRVAVSARSEIRSTQDAIRQGDDAQVQFVAGLDWINARCKSEFGVEFMDCKPEQQTGLLEELAYKAKFKPTTEGGREFFQLFRDYTVVGYYTSKIGLESLDYPGLRTVWPKMPGCTHLNDPEHLHLKKQEAAPSNKGAL